MRSNKEVYRTSEYGAWAKRSGLLPEEAKIIASYLDRSKATVEAGTGGGRILLEMARKGFVDLTGFDIVAELIDQAKRNDSTGTIRFDVQDATSLEYADASFDQIVYLQQVICFVETEQRRQEALQESYRILRPSGVALFSVLYYEVRSKSLAYRPFLLYLKLFRRLTRSKVSEQSLPWLQLGGRFNLGSMIDREPYVYWYRLEEFEQLLKKVGFTVLAIGSSKQVLNDDMQANGASLEGRTLEGKLYVACSKADSKGG